jgi:hypothetical protein
MSGIVGSRRQPNSPLLTSIRRVTSAGCPSSLDLSFARGSEIPWGPRHLLQNLTHLLGMLILGRVPHANLKSKRMLEYCGAARHEIGKKFEVQVFEALQGSTSLVLYRSIGIGPGEYFQHDVELGDFDVLACDPENAVMYPLE